MRHEEKATKSCTMTWKVFFFLCKSMKQLCGMPAESASDDRGFVFTEGAAKAGWERVETERLWKKLSLSFNALFRWLKRRPNPVI
jgi:hypothetical protein